ncbi:MAG: TIGR00730 family Rossman fold protein [Planctomycetes bacterium]|nr:TIGR00730 family Rossman fold protein [Planctomycetota bacterium]
MPSKRLCVFCGSSKGVRASYAHAARDFGERLVAHGYGLVYGGGNIGLMGEIADAVLAAGGEVVGVIPSSLVAREVGHRGLSELVVVRTMHERKAKMAELSSAFVALPGGFGTFDEFCEVVTWAQLGIHDKACALLDVDGYFDPLLALFDHAVDQGFIRRDFRALVVSERDPERLLRRIDEWQPVPNERWADRTEA